eukprot:CAMPEP_0202085010 /NCGR_PEP_ID=MMETSP0964-20121228/29454_1 /ASSEMBLY_ACC=CAM_ASM_000500 /TAXON_ID=4773 /ORGANISM="Schizochytrium aggregatum, Strain ATCC28209" /LENGTH=37 /DNA_ID= /DNA_START= /DNA_END= /DNA_ORIENTATION=
MSSEMKVGSFIAAAACRRMLAKKAQRTTAGITAGILL